MAFLVINAAALLKRAPPAGFPAADYQVGDSSEHSNKRMRPIGVSEEVISLLIFLHPAKI
jgi:hypothetical protein